MYLDFKNLVGHFLLKVKQIDNDEIYFYTLNDGDVKKYRMYHSQDCCESVYIEDIEGDLKSLEGSYISFAEESTQDKPNAVDTDMWTFYKLGSNKGWVDIRWSGSSNGYYSVSVSFIEEEISVDEKIQVLSKKHEKNILLKELIDVNKLTNKENKYKI